MEVHRCSAEIMLMRSSPHADELEIGNLPNQGITPFSHGIPVVHTNPDVFHRSQWSGDETQE